MVGRGRAVKLRGTGVDGLDSPNSQHPGDFIRLKNIGIYIHGLKCIDNM